MLLTLVFVSVSVSLSVTVFVANISSFHTPAVDNGRKAVCCYVFNVLFCHLWHLSAKAWHFLMSCRQYIAVLYILLNCLRFTT